MRAAGEDVDPELVVFMASHRALGVLTGNADCSCDDKGATATATATADSLTGMTNTGTTAETMTTAETKTTTTTADTLRE